MMENHNKNYFDNNNSILVGAIGRGYRDPSAVASSKAHSSARRDDDDGSVDQNDDDDDVDVEADLETDDVGKRPRGDRKGKLERGDSSPDEFSPDSNETPSPSPNQLKAWKQDDLDAYRCSLVCVPVLASLCVKMIESETDADMEIKRTFFSPQ